MLESDILIARDSGYGTVNTLAANTTMRRALHHLWHFSIALVRRLQHDRLTMMAGSLAYVTLLSLVPLVAVTFSIISAFPMFADFQGLIEDFVFNNFVPAAGAVVKQNLRGFVENASRMTTVGVLALMVVALLLISAIDNSLNKIFRVQAHRRWTRAFPMYWTVLTLGPLLMGGSLAVSSYLLSLQLFRETAVTSLLSELLRGLPFIFSVGMFCLLYLMVPNRRVPFIHGLAGAVVAALLFELGKRGFAIYIASFPTYQLIYGALASIPILLVWIYLSWVVVLFGAEFTAALDEYQQVQRQAQLSSGPQALDQASSPQQAKQKQQEQQQEQA